MRKLLFIPLAASCLCEITACRKHSSALPPPNDTSSKDTINIIDTPTETNSAYDSATMVFTKGIVIYKNLRGDDSFVGEMDCGARLNHFDTVRGLVIRVNSLKLVESAPYQWWQYGIYIDSNRTPGYPIYDSARIQFIAPNGFKDLDYRMPYMPFHPKTFPYIVSKNGFSIPVVGNNLAGVDSLHIDISAGYYDTTLKITDCTVYIDSVRIHQMFHSFPGNAYINFTAKKHYNVTFHGKNYNILSQSLASYQFMAQ